ncbi:uncharacterized protein Z518_08028 [Rhinocladiella mackenziei CBS 650.93]|uniref:DnaJ homologue subfamily C member 28 conserved domain-containing protein n=1 Tax=Rhinocladiella mackenziei CBS 650.93 TaxID=1442369 RepID=A0A0D2I8B0_9EURO|nr:uncharacterized protein Z518_08028 [Rhinocladiella mackenziei CBS 650.93]KIX02089.1 hypothetical protein Z518_08028 [Rhinocladiella mackenziei CBS 650.93]
MSSSSSQIWTCSRCLRAQRLSSISAGPSIFESGAMVRSRRPFSTAASLQEENTSSPKNEGTGGNEKSGQDEEEEGAMSRRLAEMAEEAMDTGGNSDRKLMQDVGFSDDLKQQLEERIAQTGLTAQNQKAASQINMPSSAGKGTQDIAGAEPWTGSESLHDSALRMLDDSHKKLRSSHKPPSVPQKVNLRPAPKKNISAADRLANARDKTSIYAFSQQSDMSEKEREKWRKELKDRFSPGARPMPTTLQGLSSLANERIEDAIARGQFKNIPRGKGKNVERDYNANSPFLDTTEYFMNKIIQKQEIVPPWIEKQQELVKAVASFRGRLRNDWRRHAARIIASSGGTIEDHVRRAKGYALAEEKVNPRVRKVENLSSISSDGMLTSITVEERIAAGVPAEAEVKQTGPAQEEVEIKVTEQPAETAPSMTANDVAAAAEPPTRAPEPAGNSVLPVPHPFRDPAWEKAELAYHTLAVQELNALTRSYNLMAPKIAQKPYYTLERELNRCFADVAPTLTDEILERSRKPVVKIGVMPHREGGVLERFGQGVGAERYRGHEGRIRDEVEGKGYGFREFWRDLFRSDKKAESVSRRKETNAA